MASCVVAEGIEQAAERVDLAMEVADDVERAVEEAVHERGHGKLISPRGRAFARAVSPSYRVHRGSRRARRYSRFQEYGGHAVKERQASLGSLDRSCPVQLASSA